MIRRILTLVSVTHILVCAGTYAQPTGHPDSVAGKALWSLALDKADDVNSALYLFALNSKKPPVSLTELRAFFEKNSLLTDVIDRGVSGFSCDTSGDVILSIDLSAFDSVRLGDVRYRIESGKAEVKLGTPGSHESSVRTFSGRVTDATLRHASTPPIHIASFEGSMGLLIADQKAIRRLHRVRTNPKQPGTPEWTFFEYYNAIAEGDYEKSVRLLDPQDVALIVGAIELALTAESGSEEIQPLLDPGETIESFRLLSLHAKAARLFKKMLGTNPIFAASFSGSTLSIVGHVMDGDSLAMVVGRTTLTIQNHLLSVLDVTPVKMVGGEWYIQLADQNRFALQRMFRGL